MVKVNEFFDQFVSRLPESVWYGSFISCGKRSTNGKWFCIVYWMFTNLDASEWLPYKKAISMYHDFHLTFTMSIIIFKPRIKSSNIPLTI